MRRDAEQPVALLDRLLDESELAVLEVADAAVDHVRRRRGRARDEVAALDEHDVDALEGEVAERGDAVDAAADDDDLGTGAVAERGDLGRVRVGGAAVLGSLRGVRRALTSLSSRCGATGSRRLRRRPRVDAIHREHGRTTVASRLHICARVRRMIETRRTATPSDRADAVTGKTRDALRAAHLYYMQDLTMDAIAHELHTSRSSVSRLLSHARASGLVEIPIHSPLDLPSRIEQEILERFEVRRPRRARARPRERRRSARPRRALGCTDSRPVRRLEPDRSGSPGARR